MNKIPGSQARFDRIFEMFESISGSVSAEVVVQLKRVSRRFHVTAAFPAIPNFRPACQSPIVRPAVILASHGVNLNRNAKDCIVRLHFTHPLPHGWSVFQNGSTPARRASFEVARFRVPGACRPPQYRRISPIASVFVIRNPFVFGAPVFDAFRAGATRPRHTLATKLNWAQLQNLRVGLVCIRFIAAFPGVKN